MGSNIQADEISSIIKERIDNFELTIDKPIKSERKAMGIAIVGCGAMPYELEAAIRAAIIDHPVKIICGSKQQIEDIMVEQMDFKNQFEIIGRHRFDHLEVFADDAFKKDHHPYGWYRKFEKKRF